MVESNRLKALARAYMVENPGTKYQQALDAVLNKESAVPAPTAVPAAVLAGNDAAGAAAWIRTLGGVPALKNWRTGGPIRSRLPTWRCQSGSAPKRISPSAMNPRRFGSTSPLRTVARGLTSHMRVEQAWGIATRSTVC